MGGRTERSARLIFSGLACRRTAQDRKIWTNKGLGCYPQDFGGSPYPRRSVSAIAYLAGTDGFDRGEENYAEFAGASCVNIRIRNFKRARCLHGTGRRVCRLRCRSFVRSNNWRATWRPGRKYPGQDWCKDRNGIGQTTRWNGALRTNHALGQ